MIKIKDEIKNGITELVFIIDRSGSMSGLEKDTIGGFNSFVEKQKKLEGKTFVTTVLFDTRWSMIHDRADLSEIKQMTENDYCPGGCTALLDALGDMIKHTEDIHKYIRPEDVPENTIFVVITDGEENSSRRFNADQIRKKVSEKEECGWEFVFLGANIDAISTAKSYGFKADNSVEFLCDGQGLENAYDSVSNFVNSKRMMCDCMAPDEWKKDVEKDTKKRKK